MSGRPHRGVRQGNKPAPDGVPGVCWWCQQAILRPSAKKVHERFCRKGPAYDPEHPEHKKHAGRGE